MKMIKGNIDNVYRYNTINEIYECMSNLDAMDIVYIVPIYLGLKSGMIIHDKYKIIDIFRHDYTGDIWIAIQYGDMIFEVWHEAITLLIMGAINLDDWRYII